MNGSDFVSSTDNFDNTAFSICNTAFIFENLGDSNPKTDIVCGESSVNWSYYRKIPASATEQPVSESGMSQKHYLNLENKRLTSPYSIFRFWAHYIRNEPNYHTCSKEGGKERIKGLDCWRCRWSRCWSCTYWRNRLLPASPQEEERHNPTHSRCCRRSRRPASCPAVLRREARLCRPRLISRPAVPWIP